MKKNLTAAFTLIELLVVITIIAILASVALPAFIGVQERAQQTKDLSNIKQVGLALKQFATDNNGSFPAKAPGGAGDYASAPANPPATSSDAFWWLFPTYLTSEQIFAVPGSAYTPSNPDDLIDDPSGGARVNTLKLGENAYSYLNGLTDTANASFPLAADGWVQPAANPPAYSPNKSIKGGVWAAKKAIVLFVDASAQIMKCTAAGAPVPLTVMRPGHNYSIFDNTHGNDVGDPWLANTILQLDPP
jgi:prepilin-type N-terminal cleavage/methylation domain-containing protein